MYYCSLSSTTFGWRAFLFLLSLSPSLWVIEMQWFYCSDDEHKYEISRQNEKKTHKRCDETSIVSLFSRNSFCALATDLILLQPQYWPFVLLYVLLLCGLWARRPKSLFFQSSVISANIWARVSICYGNWCVFSFNFDAKMCGEKTAGVSPYL